MKQCAVLMFRFISVNMETLVASCFRGALPPVDLRAVCFVRAIASSIFCDQLKILQIK